MAQWKQSGYRATASNGVCRVVVEREAFNTRYPWGYRAWRGTKRAGGGTTKTYTGAKAAATRLLNSARCG